MQTRGRVKVQTVQSSSNPVSPLEDQGQRPPSRASEDEGDLGLASLLGEGAVLDVGENHTRVSTMSGPGDVTVVAAQAPITEVEVTSSNGQIEAGSAAPLLAATGTTRLPDPCAQAPIGSSQISAFSFSRGNEPVQIPAYINIYGRNSFIYLCVCCVITPGRSCDHSTAWCHAY